MKLNEATITNQEIAKKLRQLAGLIAKRPSYNERRNGKLLAYGSALVSVPLDHVEEGLLTVEEVVLLLVRTAAFLAFTKL